MTNGAGAATLPAAVPEGWAPRRAGRPGRALAIPIVFLVLAGSALLSIVNSGDMASGLLGAAIFGSVALAAWWLLGSGVASAKPLVLRGAVFMTRAVTPPPDSWVHFAKLRGVPWEWIGTFTIFGTLSAAAAAWLAWGPREDGLDWTGTAILAGVAILCSVGALFFLGAAAMSLVTQAKSSGWPRLQGLTLGEHGVAFRLLGESRDIRWEDISLIEATFTQAHRTSGPPLPVLRIVWAHGERSFSTRVLDASPVVLFTALRFYLEHADQRAELGTTVAQARMDAWLAEVGAAA